MQASCRDNVPFIYENQQKVKSLNNWQITLMVFSIIQLVLIAIIMQGVEFTSAGTKMFICSKIILKTIIAAVQIVACTVAVAKAKQLAGFFKGMAGSQENCSDE